MAKKTPTVRAIGFMGANDEYPVIAGSVIGVGGRGAVYELSDGTSWTLKPEDLRSMPAGYPKWASPK